MDNCTPRQPQPARPAPQRVDVKPFQRAIGELSLNDPDFSWGEIARRLGWLNVKPDISRLKRTLGLQENGYGKFQEALNYETAVALCEALGIDPVDVGL